MLWKWFEKKSQAFKNRTITIVLGIVIAALVPLLNSARKDFAITAKDEQISKKDERILVLARKKDSTSLLLEIEKNKNLQLQIELIQCQSNYNLIRLSFDDVPFPVFIRDAVTRRIVYMNKAFVAQVLKPMGKTKFDLLNNPDHKVFGRKLALEYAEGDNYVVDNLRQKTKVDISKGRAGKVIEWRSTKFPIFEYGKLKAIGGIAYKIENEN